MERVCTPLTQNRMDDVPKGPKEKKIEKPQEDPNVNMPKAS